MRVLVVEDDLRLAAALRRGLGYEGLITDLAGDGEEALRLARASEYDAIVLDVMLPGGLDGFETCRRIRKAGVWAPVIMLTARDAVEDRVRGLDEGADDYLTKPFSLAELLARLRAVARRGAGSARPCSPSVTSASIRRRARSGALARPCISPRASSPCSRRSCGEPGQVLSQDQLLEAAWELGYRSAIERRRGVRPLLAREDRPAVRGPLAGDGARGRLQAEEGRWGMSRIPIRARLTAAFALAMALLLAAAGTFVYLRLESDLNESIDDTLARTGAGDRGHRVGHAASARGRRGRAGGGGGRFRPGPDDYRRGGRLLCRPHDRGPDGRGGRPGGGGRPGARTTGARSRRHRPHPCLAGDRRAASGW